MIDTYLTSSDPINECSLGFFVSLPYNPSLSKNAHYKRARNGRMFISKESVAARNEVHMLIRRVLEGSKLKFEKAKKIWVKIVVLKPDNRMDAINFLDAIADVLKKEIDVDDRYFSVALLDWRIEKNDPKILLEVFQ